MTLRTKGEQKAYLDGYEMCADCIEKYLTDEGKRKLECLLVAVRNAVEIEDVEPQESGYCFTDEEKRIFLASVAREMRVCEVIDSEKTKVKLVPILERVKDKVLRSSLWKEVEE